MQDFVHTDCQCGRSQGTQTTNHAQYGNVQILKNNIDGEGYQPVAEEGFEVCPDRNTRVAPVGLGSGCCSEHVESLPKPTEVEPGEGGADQDASAPVCSVEAGDGDGGERAEEKGETGDPFFGLEIRGDVDGGRGHGLGVDVRKFSTVRGRTM